MLDQSPHDGRRRTTLALAGAAALAGGLAWKLRPGESLDGRVALVTGGSRGLGFLIARRLLEEGCRVVICARDRDTLDRAANRLSAHGRVVACTCDVTDRAAIARTVRETIERFGRIDVLVNNAMVIQVAALEALDRGDFERAMAIGFWGTLDTTLEVLPHMRRAGGGRIANITSIGGKVAVPHLLPYDCAKFATVGLSEGLRAELAEDGILVTTVVPGLMTTGSPVHVEYRGQPRKEYAWFALGDILPISAMSAERAARRIVRAIRRGEAEVVLSWQAKMLRVLHDLAPGTTVRALGLANRLLPDAVPARAGGANAEAKGGAADRGAAGAQRRARGESLRGTLPEPVERALDRAGERSNQ